MPSVVNLSELEALPDFLSSTSYRLEIPIIPGSYTDSSLSVHCTSAIFPGVSNETAFKEIMGQRIPHRGIKNQNDNTLTVVYTEDENLSVYNAFKGWHDIIVDPITGNGSNKQGYTTTGLFFIFDNKGNQTSMSSIVGMYPKRISELPFSGESSNLIHVSVEFCFDYVGDLNETIAINSAINFGVNQIISSSPMNNLISNISSLTSSLSTLF